jgi:hypothetical protein
MASIRKGYCTALALLLFITNTSAQVIYYPLNSSSLLKSTVEDVAGLLQKAVEGSHFSTSIYATLPTTGIVLVYDSTITDNQLCKVQGNGVSYLQFNAAEDNGLAFGIYQYLAELGFKFYQPGSIWEIMPSLTSPFKNIQKEYNTPFKYKTWFISGGHRPWIMDKTVAYDWDTYSGENGHNWSLYQRRNGMNGAYRFTGHRGDIINGAYLSTIQNNPCYVASYNGSRQATSSSVPDVNNPAAKQLWAQTIQQKYTQYSNTIKNNSVYFSNQFRNFNYSNNKIGIEVPDGPRWANSTDSLACATGVYQTEADQNIVLANYTAKKIKEIYPAKRFQMYAYFTHANVPSASITIDSSIDIQVPMAFQSESSSKGLLNRWYSRHKSISEYHYMNIPAWSGETPSFYLAELKQTLKRLKEKNSQGIYWEASPAKFASLPFLWASNSYLINNKEVEDALLEFCNQMFGPAAETVYELLHLMTNENTITVGGSTADNFYKLPLFFKMLQQASLQTMQSEDIVKQRINELKVYFHYMSLYYDCNYNQKINILERQSKTAELCIYLARINKMQLVNSYYLITSLISRFKSDNAFISMYNVKTGTAYQNGNLSLITPEQIEQDYQQDISKYINLVSEYNIQSESFVAAKIAASNFIPAEKIQIKIGYSNGSNFPNRSVFGIQAKSKGSFSIQYIPRFDIPGVGYINFLVEKTDKVLGVVKDFSINASSGAGVLQVDIPEAGEYILCITSKQKSGVEIVINTNGFAFNKNTAFLGRSTEDYSKNIKSLPGYYYVPEGMRKVYFNIHNSYAQGLGFAKKEVISDVFIFKDNLGNRVHPVYANTSDSSFKNGTILFMF